MTPTPKNKLKYGVSPADAVYAKVYVLRCVLALGIPHKVNAVIKRSLGRSTSPAQIDKDSEFEFTITFSRYFFLLDPDMKRRVVAHELMHLVTWPLANLIPDSHSATAEHVEEAIVNTLEEIVAPLLPQWETK